MGFQDRGYSRDSRQPFMADWTAVMTIMVINIAIWVGVGGAWWKVLGLW